MKEGARFEEMRDDVPRLHGQSIKKVPEANKPSSCQSYPRDTLNLAGCWGFTDELMGDGIVIVEGLTWRKYRNMSSVT